TSAASNGQSISRTGTSHRSSACPTIACCGTTTCRCPGSTGHPSRRCTLHSPSKYEVVSGWWLVICGLGEGGPLNWPPSAVADAGNGRRAPSADAVAEDTFPRNPLACGLSSLTTNH